jgi:cytochrome P450
MLASAQRVMSVEEAVRQAEIELDAQHHLAREFAARRDNPTDDLISLLVHSHRAPAGDERGDDGGNAEPLSIEELQDLLHQMVTGGFETTTTALTTGLWLLIRHPEQMAMLRADRSLLDNFIDESLRVDSPVAGLWRTTTRDVELAGVGIPQHSSVMVRYAAANRDPAHFVNPEKFDITRSNANEHVAFGFGNHFCVGAWLARTELRIAFTALLDRLDDIELARPLEPLPHEFSFFLRPMKELPIVFTSR